MDDTAEAEKLDQLLAKFPQLSAENQQYITGLIKGLKHAQNAPVGESSVNLAESARETRWNSRTE
jgi:hypothetical protein